MKLDVQLDYETVAPGQQLSGRVVVLEGGDSEKLTLAVRFWERSPAFLVPAFEDSMVVQEGALTTGGEVAFTYPVPMTASPSLKGKHGELFWELEAVADNRGLGLDARAAKRFEVVRRDS